ncbi:MAG TPA: hypothetical protein VNZ45_02600 [Bacteroidia bacterium]|jgi:hypothetical protein|nr:hypothetical protein [Bacteroidia bacterium]
MEYKKLTQEQRDNCNDIIIQMNNLAGEIALDNGGNVTPFAETLFDLATTLNVELLHTK